MTPDDLKAVSDPASLTKPLQALLADYRGDWDLAHELAQVANSSDGDWVHAYLHRKEGDIANAGYWYRRAHRAPVGSSVSLEEEWEQIATELLAKAAVE